MTKEKLPKLTMTLAKQVAKKWFGTAAGLHLTEESADLPLAFRQYEMVLGKLRITIGYTPNMDGYQPGENLLRVETHLCDGYYSPFGASSYIYLNPMTLDENFDARLAQETLDKKLYAEGNL